MLHRINKMIDVLSNFFAQRKGLLPFLGILLILVNWLLQVLPIDGWVVSSDLFLHFGVILSIIGIMLAWAL